MDVLLNNDVETVDFGETAMRVKLTREVIEVKEINDIGSVRILMLKGEKGDVGYPTDEQVSEAVDEWLTNHPEATTTVQDNSLTWVKFNDVLKNMMFKLGITDSKSGELVSTSDAAEFPLKDLQSEITATQNLNGYEYPWVGGAGKNKLPTLNATQTINGIVWKLNDDGSVTLNGKATANSVYDFGRGTLHLTAGTYTTNLSDADVSVYVYENTTPATYIISGGTFTIDHDADIFVRFWIDSGKTVNVTEYPQLELGSTATAYAPYENICPISGRTEVNVTRTGKNLLQNTATTQTINGVTFTVNSDGTISLSGTATANTIFDIPNFSAIGGTAYILNGCPSGGSTSTYLLSIPGVGYDAGNGYNYNPATDATITVRITIYNGQNTDGLIFKPMIRLATFTDEEYEPYEGDTFNTELGRTVYGGTLDLTTGELTVNTGLIASYNGETIGEPWISDRDRYVAGTTPTIGAQVVYTKTSETYQVDRTEVDAYFKNNTIWSDSGDVAVSYLVDAKTYIDNQ